TKRNTGLPALSVLRRSRVVEAEYDGNGAERFAEPGAGPVRGFRRVNGRPLHLLVLGGEPGHGVGELHGGDAVPPQQGAPPERGERRGELADRQAAPCGQVDPVYRGGELDEVARALDQRRRLRRIRGSVVIERTDLLAVHGRVAVVGLALHPVDGGEQFPADAGAGGHVPVQVLAPRQRRLGAGEERGADRVRELRVVGGRLGGASPAGHPRRGDDAVAGGDAGNVRAAAPWRGGASACAGASAGTRRRGRGRDPLGGPDAA